MGDMDHKTVSIWVKSHKLLRVASTLAGKSQVDFLHDALVEKVIKDGVPVPYQYIKREGDDDEQNEHN